MTEIIPFPQNAILLFYEHCPFAGGVFAVRLPKSAQKISWKFCEIATIQITDFVIKCK